MQSGEGGKDIITIKPDGTDFADISDGGYVEQFLVPHPLGYKFLYQDNLTHFYTRSMDGTDLIQLTNRVVYPDQVKYSPGGSWIAYIAYHGETRHIYTINSDGSNRFTLTDYPPDEDVEFPTEVWSFDWSPGATHIIFEGELNNQRDIFIIESDGGKLRNLTNTPDLNEYTPVYSPGGSMIAYSAGDEQESSIYVMTNVGTFPTALTDLDGRSYQPTWSNDGHQIAFLSDHDGDEEVFVVDPDGDDLAQLTHNETREYWLDWSPDSCWLAYRSVVDDTGISEIFRTSPDGSETFQITNRGSWILRFYWVDN